MDGSLDRGSIPRYSTKEEVYEPKSDFRIQEYFRIHCQYR